MKLRSVKRAHHFTRAFRHAFAACASEHVKQTMLLIVQLGSHVLRQVTHTHPQKRTDQPVGLLDPDRGNHTTTTGGRNGQDGQIDSPCCCTGSRCGNPSPCCSCDISGFISPPCAALVLLLPVCSGAGPKMSGRRTPRGIPVIASMRRTSVAFGLPRPVSQWETAPCVIPSASASPACFPGYASTAFRSWLIA